MLQLAARWGLMLLPILMLIPEVLEVGGTFIRWDYLLLPLGLALMYHRLAFGKGIETRLGYYRPALWSLGLLFLFTAYQLFQVDTQLADSSDAVKYALWPIKVVVWAFCVREVVMTADDPQARVYQLFATMGVLVLCIQMMEMTLPAFRDFLNVYFPTAAKERLSALDYRARGVFNGYDTASLFFCLVAIVTDQYARHAKFRSDLKHVGLMAVCLAGSVLSARTGFLLLAVYIGVELWRSASWTLRAIALVALVNVALVVITFPTGLTGEEGTLGGRYLEIINFVHSGDPTSVNSFLGTLYMNYALFFTYDWNVLWGNGLDPATTADQLYSKYLFMFGVVGTSLWAMFHVSFMALLMRAKSSFKSLPSAAFLYLLLMAVAHVKGGNYLFAQRLGELTMLVLLLAITKDDEDVAASASDTPASDTPDSDTHASEQTLP